MIIITSRKRTSYVTASDIGGTKTILSVVSTGTGPGAAHVEIRYPGGTYARMVNIVQKFLRQNWSLVKRRLIIADAFGASVSVGNSKAAITNLDWIINQSALAGPHFRHFFSKKGRVTEMMSKIPVHVILYPKTVLLGAAYVTLELDN